MNNKSVSIYKCNICNGVTALANSHVTVEVEENYETCPFCHYGEMKFVTDGKLIVEE